MVASANTILADFPEMPRERKLAASSWRRRPRKDRALRFGALPGEERVGRFQAYKYSAQGMDCRNSDR
jgi:hypothetical protein